MILVAASEDTVALGARIGTPVVAEAGELMELMLAGNYTGLVYLRNLADPNSVCRYDDGSALHSELLIVKTLCLGSDMFDIPLTAVVWGGSKVIPTTPQGVWWAMIEDAVAARQAQSFRVNGLFGPDLHNDVWRALETDVPVFDAVWEVNPLFQDDFVFEVMVRNRDLAHSGLIGAQSTTWFQLASEVVLDVRPWQPPKTQRLIEAGSGRSKYRRKKADWDWARYRYEWEPSWEAGAEGARHTLLDYQRDQVVVETALAQMAVGAGHRVFKGFR